MLKQTRLAAVLLFCMVLGLYTGRVVYAESTGRIGTSSDADTTYTGESNLILQNTSIQSMQATAGGKLHVKAELRLKKGDLYAWDNEVTLKVVPESSYLTIKNITYEVEESRWTSWQDDFYISEDTSLFVEYDILVDDFAKIGRYSYYITYVMSDELKKTYEGMEEVDMSYLTEPGKVMMEINVVNEKTPPRMAVLSATEYYVDAGDSFSLDLTIGNQGELKAMNTYLYVDYTSYADLLIPSYSPLDQKVGNLGVGETASVSVSYKVTENAETSLLRLPIKCSYKTADGTSVSDELIGHIYLHVQGKVVPTPTVTPTPTPTVTPTPTPTPIPEERTLLLNTVTQSPATPKAGGSVKVTFFLENKGNVDLTNVKVSMPQLASSGFEPVSSEPYQYIGTIKQGERQQVEIEVKIKEDIKAGANILPVQYSYDSSIPGEELTETEQIYVLNVREKQEVVTVISRPKLMVSNFYSDPEEVKAGDVFDFTFEIMNTNNSIYAKNIKVTVTGGTAFSVTSGGNSFFVNKISAQETTPITINLKASAAVTTGAYPITVKIEYEYEGMTATDSYSGEVVTEEILLQVKENLRPSVENVYIGSWDTPVVNQSTSLNFEFYNMGKSTLNNTYVTIEGDFMLGNGSNSYYIGNISAGMPEYVEFDVIPLVEGDAVGKMIIHMEDSNGDEVTMEKEFTSYVMGETSWDNSDYMSDIDYFDPSIPADNPEVVQPILPLWMFLAIQGGILVVVIPTTRAIRLFLYRKKVKKEDAE